MEDKTLTLTEVQTGVRKLTQFEIRKEDLLKMVEISKKITVPDVSNKDQVAIAKTKRIELRKVEIDIEKQGKGYRGVFRAINEEISAKEKELKKITSPEIGRLEAIEDEAEKLILTEKRKAMLPVRKERLLGVDPSGCYICADKYLLDMDADAFEKYFNDCVSNKNERNRLRTEKEAEDKRKAEEEKIALERMALEAEKKKIEDQKEADRLEEEKKTEDARIAEEKEEKEAEETEQYRRAGLLKERREALKAIGDSVPELADEQFLTFDDNAYNKYYNDRVTAKNDADKKVLEDLVIASAKEAEDKKKAEAQLAEDKRLADEAEKAEKERIEKEEKDRKAEMEKKEAYKAFLKKHGWTPETRLEFENREVIGGFELWRKVGVFTR